MEKTSGVRSSTSGDIVVVLAVRIAERRNPGETVTIEIPPGGTLTGKRLAFRSFTMREPIRRLIPPPWYP
jgi:hypothetical protein